jgi:hypothetical protein
MTRGNTSDNTTYDTETGHLYVRRIAGQKQMSFRPDTDGYLTMRFEGKMHKQHRVAWFLTHGEWPEVVDHINGIRDDNRLCNLRRSTHSENSRNVAMGTGSQRPISGLRKRPSGYEVVVLKSYIGTSLCLGAALKMRNDARDVAGGFTSRHGN